MTYLNDFNANEIDPVSIFEPIPAGKYVATIIESEMKETKSGNGEYLQLTFELCEEPHKGRRLWARLNLENPSDQAVQIARGQLSAICHAVGVMQPNDSCDLHDLPLTIRVVCKKRDDTGEMTNEINGYEKEESASPCPPSATGAAGAQEDESTPPWQK